MFPKEVHYAATHEWVRLEDDLATVGITAYAAEQLSDITYIELPSVGQELAKGAVLGTVESVKAAADLVSPIDGEVVAVNEAVVGSPDLISEDPFGAGWLVKLRPSEPSQLEGLMTAEQYRVLVQAEPAGKEDDVEETKEDMDEVE